MGVGSYLNKNPTFQAEEQQLYFLQIQESWWIKLNEYTAKTDTLLKIKRTLNCITSWCEKVDSDAC